VNGRRSSHSFTAIIQARMQSKRLPAKSMLDLAGKPLVDHVIERAKAIPGVDTVVLATGMDPANLILEERAHACDVEFFAGSDENVLERYVMAARMYPATHIIRITADNPFTDPEYAGTAAEIAVESDADLTSVTNIPLGSGVEIIKRAALEEAYANASTAYHREHVTPYIKEHPELFMIERHPVEIEGMIPGLRLTVDTPEDFELVKRLHSEINVPGIIPLRAVLAHIAAHPVLMAINASVTQRPMTHAE
jgi:spore coat polysaccharide biosynthesis protein SpsF